MRIPEHRLPWAVISAVATGAKRVLHVPAGLVLPGRLLLRASEGPQSLEVEVLSVRLHKGALDSLAVRVAGSDRSRVVIGIDHGTSPAVTLRDLDVLGDLHTVDPANVRYVDPDGPAVFTNPPEIYQPRYSRPKKSDQ